MIPAALRAIPWRNTAAQFANQFGTKGLELAVMVMAAHTLRIESMGLAFFALAFAGVLNHGADFGLFTVLFRRSARTSLDRQTLARALVIRGSASVLIGALYAIGINYVEPKYALVLLTFYSAATVGQLHSLLRAAIMGKEHFVINAQIGVGSRIAGTAFIACGFWLGFGVEAWAVGRLLSQILQGIFLWLLVRRMPGDDVKVQRRLLQEGLPFWLMMTATIAATHAGSLLLAFTVGLKFVGFFGLAGRVIGGASLLIAVAATVAFPKMAQTQRRTVSRQAVGAIVVGAVVMGVSVVIFAPILARLVLGQASQEMVVALRWLAPIVVLVSIEIPARTWAVSRDRERWLAATDVICGAVSVALTVWLVPSFGFAGAIAAGVGRSFMRTGGYVAVVFGAVLGFQGFIGRAASSLLWPAGESRRRRIMAAWVRWSREQIAARVSSQLDGRRFAVAEVDPAAFQPGKSTFELEIFTPDPTAAEELQHDSQSRLRWLPSPGAIVVSVIADGRSSSSGSGTLDPDSEPQSSSTRE